MSLAKLFVEVGANTRSFQNSMQDVRSEIDRTSKEASNFAQTINTAIGVGLANAASTAINALTRMGKSIVATGIEFNSLEQNSTLAFETMLGSTAKATDFLNKLKLFAKQTPFELPGLIESSQRLLAFGFDANKIIPILTSVGDAVAGLGGSPEKLNRVLLALGQIRAKGKVAAGEMLQLTEAGIPAWEMLAKKIGVSIPEAMKMSEKGAISAETAINAVIEGMNKKFGGLMDKQSKSFSGMWSNIKDVFTQTTGKVMKPLFQILTYQMGEFLKLLESPKFVAFTNKMQRLMSWVALEVGHTFNGLFALLQGDFSGFFKSIKNGFSLFWSVITESKSNPFSWLINAFGGLDKVLKKYENKRFGWLSNFTPKEAITAIKGFIQDLKYGGKNLDYWIGHTPKLLQPLERISISALKVWKYLAGEGIQATLKKLGSILTGLGSVLARLVRPFKEALGGLFEQLSTMKNLGFADVFKAVLDSVVKAFSGFLAVIKNEFWPTVKGALIWVFDNVYSFVTAINWGNLWTNLITSISSIYTTIASYLSSVDWNSVWSTIWSGLATINDFFKSTVFPALGNFFDWLLSWFSDSSKNNQLLAAVTATWSFIADWASYIWSGVSPYLSSFFGWLTSWFTDQSKRQQLYGAITTTWSFVTTWASELWGFVYPYLGSFWKYLVDWTQNRLFPNMQSWAIAFTSWSVNLWSSYLQPTMVSWWTSFYSWMTTTFPKTKEPLDGLLSNFNSLFDQLTLLVGIRSGSINKDWGKFFSDFFSLSKLNLDQTLANLITMVSAIIGGFDNLVFMTRKALNGDWAAVWEEFKRITLVVWDFLKEHFNFNGPDSQFIIQGMQNLGNGIYNALMNPLKTIGQGFEDYAVKPFKAAINQLVNAYNSFSSIASVGGMSLPQLQLPFPGFAKGGITKEGLTLVGEKGPELAQLPKGTRVWDHGQSMGKLQQNQPATYQPTMQQSSNQTITVILKNEGELVASRKVIDDIAVALQRKLTGNGNRVVFA